MKNAKKKIRIFFISLALMQNQFLYSLDFSSISGSLTSALGGSSDLSSLFSDGFSKTFSLGALNIGFNLKCNLPPNPVDNILNQDICSMLSSEVGSSVSSLGNLTNLLTQNLTLGSCRLTTSASSLGNAITKSVRNICNTASNSLQSAWKVYNVSQTESKEIVQYYDPTVSPTTVTSPDGKSLEVKTITYPNGETTQTLYGSPSSSSSSNGILTFQSISEGKRVPEEMRQAYASDDVPTYKTYVNVATHKPLSASSGSSSEKAIPKVDENAIGVPNTYLEYIADKQSVVSLRNSYISPRRVYVANLRQEIIKLKKDVGLDNLEGDSSEAMLADYNSKVLKVATELLSLETDENGKPKTVYGKQVYGIKKYEALKHAYEEDMYDYTHDVVVQPSKQKVLIQPKHMQIKYAYKIMMQERREINSQLDFQRRVDKEIDDLTDLTMKTFYESLQYHPEIAQKAIEEILNANSVN